MKRSRSIVLGKFGCWKYSTSTKIILNNPKIHNAEQTMAFQVWCFVFLVSSTQKSLSHLVSPLLSLQTQLRYCFCRTILCSLPSLVPHYDFWFIFVSSSAEHCPVYEEWLRKPLQYWLQSVVLGAAAPPDSSGITWELTRNTHFQTPSGTQYNQQFWCGAGEVSREETEELANPPGDCNAHQNLGFIWQENPKVGTCSW